MTRHFAAFATAACMALSPIAAAAAELSPENIDGATTVTAEAAYDLFNAGVVFVDVRKASDFDAGRVPGAVHLDVSSDLTEESLGAVVAKSDPVVFYCNGHSCLRSSEATVMAIGWGYSEVYYLRDGYPSWEAAGFPIE